MAKAVNDPDEPVTRGGAATLRDVAARAGVNAATASVVLNNARSGTRVSESTRERIQAAATALRYRPNAAARGMKRRRMNTIGVVAVIDGGELNLYFLELLNGILEAAAKQKHLTTVYSVADWQAEEQNLLGFCDGRVDGMILIGPRVAPVFAQTLHAHAPFVTINSDNVLPSIPNLHVDNEAGAYRVVRHLIEHGHRRILHLTGQWELTSTQQRLRGYRRALEESGIAFDETLVIPCRYSHGAAKERMTELLRERSLSPFPTAVFGASDAVATGCLEALTAHGLRVPQEVSVVGFDDTMAARMTNPPLTTVRQPFRTMGQYAVRLLLEQLGISDTTNAALVVADMPMELIVRDSVAPPDKDFTI